MYFQPKVKLNKNKELNMEEILIIEKEFDQDLANATEIKLLEDVRVAYLGKKGKLTNLMPKIREIPVENRKEFGQKINALKNIIF